MDLEKLAQEKTEMQRHYVMVSSMLLIFFRIIVKKIERTNVLNLENSK